MDYKNVVGRQVGRIRSNRGWSQADLARELQKAGWDISRSEVSKIEMRIREVKDWQMMLLVHVLNTPHASFYPRLEAKAGLRDALAAAMMKKPNSRASPTFE
jgi:ribosome-binding protein aMBF1 (putative translation factor)